MSALDDICMTAGRLREALEGVPDDAPVYYQRIEDFYFETHGWETKELVFEPNFIFGRRDDIKSEYIRAFSANAWDINQGAFVINAHY